MDDDALLLLVARRVLGGPTEDGRASYQVSLGVCEQCGRARQVADGESIEVSRAAAEMVYCDAQHVPRAHVGTVRNANANANATPPRATQDVPPATRRLVLRRDHHRGQVPSCRHATWVDVHHVESDGRLYELQHVPGAHVVAKPPRATNPPAPRAAARNPKSRSRLPIFRSSCKKISEAVRRGRATLTRGGGAG